MKDDDFGKPPKRPFQLARPGDPRTSFEAADKIIPKRKKIQWKVMETHIKAFPSGLTDWDLEEICGSHGSTYRTRRSELTELGLIVDSGRVKFQNGSNRIIWILGNPAEPVAVAKPIPLDLFGV